MQRFVNSTTSYYYLRGIMSEI